MTTKQEFLRIRELIERKQYPQARKALLKIDHPTAEKWLAKLDQIAPTKLHRRWPWVLAVLLALLVVVILAFVIWSDQFWDDFMAEDRAEAQGIILAYCSLTSLTDDECSQWADNALSPSHTSKVMVCQDMYVWAADPDGFLECLQITDFPMP